MFFAKKEYCSKIVTACSLLMVLLDSNIQGGMNDFHGKPLEFVVVIPSYNNAAFYKRNLDDICNQIVDVPVEILYLDDCSTDGTGELVDQYVREHNLQNKITVIHNKRNLGQVENMYDAIHTCDDHKIILEVDGDDFLPNPYVFQRIAKEYQKKDVWLTYGQIEDYPQGGGHICKPYPKEILAENKFREYKWVTSALRTFKAGLFKRIKKEDMLMKDGTFYKITGDFAFMLPMLEMASQGHISFITEVTYLYNRQNPISDYRLYKKRQRMFADEIRAKAKYAPLASL